MKRKVSLMVSSIMQINSYLEFILISMKSYFDMDDVARLYLE